MTSEILLTVLGLLAFAVIVLEAALRWADGVPLFAFPNFVGQSGDIVKYRAAIPYDAKLGWKLAPNLRGDGTSLNTDEHGNRLNSKQPRPMPLGGIVACGDSFTAGSGVSDEYSWPAHLENILGVPVVNASA